jgi:hypothetical protein
MVFYVKHHFLLTDLRAKTLRGCHTVVALLSNGYVYIKQEHDQLTHVWVCASFTPVQVSIEFTFAAVRLSVAHLDQWSQQRGEHGVDHSQSQGGGSGCKRCMQHDGTV